PTAQAFFVDTLATATSEFPPGPGFGVVTCVQAVPLKCAASVSGPCDDVEYLPTAHTSEAEEAETPLRRFLNPGLGLISIFHPHAFGPAPNAVWAGAWGTAPGPAPALQPERSDAA